jgi:hypothetical protein
MYFTLSCIMQKKVTVSWDQSCRTKTIDTCLIFNECTRIKFIMRTSKLFTTFYENLLSPMSCICVDNVRWLYNDLNPFCYIGFLKYFLTLLHLLPLRFNCIGRCWDRTLCPHWSSGKIPLTSLTIIDQNIFPAMQFQSPSCSAVPNKYKRW